MKFVEVMHIYMYNTLCDFGLYLLKQLTVEFALNTMINAADNGY